MRKKLTWKSDKNAQGHSAFLSTQSGQQVTVKNTRTDRAVRGAMVVDGSRGSGQELVRHASSPFELTLVTGVRSETGITPVQASKLAQKSIEKYYKNVSDKNGNRIGSSPYQDELWGQYNLQVFVDKLQPVLDTIRCGGVADDRFYRDDCLDTVINELSKAVNDITQAEISMHKKWQWRHEYPVGKLAFAVFINELVFGKDTKFSENINELLDEADLSVPVEAIRSVAKNWKWLLEPNAMVDTKDSIIQSIKVALDLAFALNDELPDPPETPNISGSGGKNETESSGATCGGGTFGSYQQHVDYTDFESATFDDYFDVEFDKFVTENDKQKAEQSGTLSTKPMIGDEPQLIVSDENLKDYVDVQKHTSIIKSYTQEAVKLHANTINLLQDVEKMGLANRHRYGMVTSDIWKLKRLGDTKVFGKSMKKSGRLLVMVDLSGSMGYGYDETDNGYLAYQTSTAIAEAFPNAEVYGFNSDYQNCYVYPIEHGFMLGRKAVGEGFRHGGNTDCSALLFLEQKLQGEYADSMAVMISDGSPNPPSPFERRHLHSHTKQVAYRLYEQGLRYVSVLIGRYTDDTYYPSDVSVRLNSVEDIQDVGNAIHRISDTFN